jgi:hypothetical protein
MTHVQRYSCKVQAICVRVQWKLNFLNRVSKNPQISNFMKNHPVGTDMFRADKQTDGQIDRQT